MHPLHLRFGHCYALTTGGREDSMKPKILAVMLLAGGSMCAKTRFSVGIGVSGQGGGFYQPPPSHAYDIPPCPGCAW